MDEAWPWLCGLPPLAGICTPEEALRPGLSVDECVRRLKRYHYTLVRLQEIFTVRIPSEPIYELKMAFSLHAHLCSEHAHALRQRVAEMREPPLGLEDVPDPDLEAFFQEILGAPTTAELVTGLYEVALPELRRALQAHLDQTNPLADHPTVRLGRFALLEVDQMLRFGAQAVAHLVSPDLREAMEPWRTVLLDRLRRSGGVMGPAVPDPSVATRQYAASPYRFDPVPRRDERFPDPYNMGVNAEAFLYDPRYPPTAKVLQMYYKRLREIDVPEVLASIIAESPGEPWAYYRDMTRQLWDEARHALMGEVGFADLGLDWRQVMINFTWSLGLNTQLSALDRHAVLYFIEQGLMPKTGKRYEWEVARDAGNVLATTFQDYDWADEVLHAHIGRQWYVPRYPTAREALLHGDQAWSRVLLGWAEWKRKGLTEHRNWWPDLYRTACARMGQEPDPDVLAFHQSYEETRADLRPIGG